MTPDESATLPVSPPPVADPVTTPCPKCGAKSQYDPASRQLKCPFCGATAAIASAMGVLWSEPCSSCSLLTASVKRSAAMPV